MSTLVCIFFFFHLSSILHFFGLSSEIREVIWLNRGEGGVGETVARSGEKRDRDREKAVKV
ncbi:glycoside hydrolase family 78 protein [Sesbania bispinosa]|nr:glycoside hydrolase family 78 protein [Sesbania bispinosa]